MAFGKHLPFWLSCLLVVCAIVDQLNQCRRRGKHQRGWYWPTNTVAHLELQIENGVLDQVIELMIFRVRHEFSERRHVKTHRPDLGDGFDYLAVDVHAATVPELSK